MRLFRWLRKRDNQPQPQAEFKMEIYDDCVGLSMQGNEVKIGGALIMVMSRNPYIFEMVNNAVEATKRQHQRQSLMTLNLN